MSDYFFRGSIADIDPAVHELLEIEAERQYRRLILIPSESTAPLAVRSALDSSFQNIYAEGYPPDEWQQLSEDEILDYDSRLGEYRRLSDPRYYKGVEYANIVESLAKRRAAEVFAANGLTADDLYINVQALSGGPANNAVYHALVNPGDTVMGMNLIFGGHLSHGSPVNRSGKYFNIVSYTINDETEQLDYEEIRKLALKHKPKMIIGGYSSYPWQADWQAYREIADEVGAYLLADVAHVAGLIAGGVYPSPIGIADVVTTTTHKTLCGPRGAMIMTHKRLLARKLDRAVFPGEQGGPHVNVFAALSIALKLAQTEQFAALQAQMLENCQTFTNRLSERGFNIPFGGTNTHLMNLDTKSVVGPDGTRLSGDMAARVLDLAGIVVNRNTIPGDRSPLNPSGVRMGTPWITQRGFKEKEVTELADVIADLLQACTPYKDKSARIRGARTKVDFVVLQEARARVQKLAENAGIDYEPTNHGAPHFAHRDGTGVEVMDWAIYEISGDKVREFANLVFSSDVETLKLGDTQATTLVVDGKEVRGVLRLKEEGTYLLRLPGKHASAAAMWLRDLSDGFIHFDEDVSRKIPGPVNIRSAGHGIGQSTKVPEPVGRTNPVSGTKPFFIQINKKSASDGSSTSQIALPSFKHTEKDGDTLRKTPLHQAHVELGARMVPFGGWDMPVWYSSVKEEHLAVRSSAGLFDVSHMGVYQAEGIAACAFLDSVCSNDISALSIGESCYTHFLDTDSNVIDDLLVYRRGRKKYLVVVNASNDDKDWAWLNAVKEGRVKVDNERPWTFAFGRDVTLRNLRDPKEGADQRVDLALQGPKSREILLKLTEDQTTRQQISKLKRTELTDAKLGEFDLVVSRTGYTGSQMGFELFVHPDKLEDLWNALLEAGKDLGLLPCGLGARDSLRTEAGLPLYGHEMGGELNMGAAEAGFGRYVKVYKPWFIGREAFIKRESKRAGVLVRFTFDEQNVRMAHLGDPVLDKRGRTIGVVTSCAVDKEGYLTGQAYLELKYTPVGTPIYIFQSAPKKAGKAPSELRFGDRTPVPTPAKVVRRFPKL